MADNKQYISQTLDNGSVLIAEEVLVSIIAQAVAEVENVFLSGKPGKNWGKGVKVTIVEDDKVDVTCYVNVAYNQSVVAIANSVQDAIITALESMTGVTVAGVNVNVCGIDR